MMKVAKASSRHDLILCRLYNLYK